MSSAEPGPAARVRRWLDAALGAVDPAMLVAESLRSAPLEADLVIAIGKASAAMCRGAARAAGGVRGVCVSNAVSDLPAGVELMVGDHPVPGASSYQAGKRVLNMAGGVDRACLALVSGGGSALCEWPRQGVEPSYVTEVYRRLLASGEPIERANLLRGHLSAIKSGGLAGAGRGPFHTLVLSDVAGAGPETVASGPTIPMEADPDEARRILEGLGVGVPEAVLEAMRRPGGRPSPGGEARVVGDGMTAARALADAASAEGVAARVTPRWLAGDLETALDDLLDGAGEGLTVAAGETCVEVAGGGKGGRNTHAALLAAARIAGTRSVFAAFATDGIDGVSDAAGAIVDGSTVGRGGDPTHTLARFDSAGYLGRTGDLVVTGPTGTNVADLWIVWNP